MIDNGFDDPSRSVDPDERQNRARTYLRRIIALTGATETSHGYVLDVGRTRFFVYDGYVGRQRDMHEAESDYRRTCFRMPYKSIPKLEQIATALLQLKSNPALFDQWASQSGAYKADGHGFRHA